MDRDAESEARRRRKRENDRKAQRVARERSKKRIEHLEFLLENLRKDEGHDDSTELADRLEKATAERDALLDSLRSIETLVQRQIARHADIVPSASSGPSGPPPPPPPPDDEDKDNGNGNGPGPCDRPPSPPSQSLPIHPPPPPPPPPPYEEEDGTPSPPPHDPQTQPDGKWWVAKKTMHRPSAVPVSSRDLIKRQDVPVRAAVEGWDAVDRSGRMSPFWAVLRALDEQCMPQAGPVERIGFLHMMHTLMLYHAEPTQENFENLPPYYWMRPSQALPHPYAADYFPWPGLRERFVFSEYRYNNEDFSVLFPTQLHVLWPYDFSDIYTISPIDGTYSVTPLFDQQIRNIQAWTMRPDFFARFPELLSDIPVSNSIPGSVRGYRPPAPPEPHFKAEEAEDGDDAATTRQMVRYPAWDGARPQPPARKRQRSVPLIEAPPSPGPQRQRRPRLDPGTRTLSGGSPD